MVVGGHSYRWMQIRGQPHRYLNLQYLGPWHDGDDDGGVEFGQGLSLLLVLVCLTITMLGF